MADPQNPTAATPAPAPAPDPYAAYGGMVAPATPTSSDPYAAYGGKTLEVPRTHLSGEDAGSGTGLLDTAMGVGVGVAKGAAQTVQGGEKLLNHILPANHQIPIINEESTKNANAAQSVGGGAEDVMEFMAGDEALSGLAKAAKLVEAADKYPLIAKTLKAAKVHPVLAKMISEGTKSAVVGGAQGALKGAEEGDAVKGAEGGAVGGGLGGAVVGGAVEAATPLAQDLAKKFGIGTSAVEDATRGARPGKRNVRFAEDFLRSAPYVDAENAAAPAKSVEEWADHFDSARQKLYDQKIDPLVQKHATVPLGGLNIAESIRNDIPDAMKNEDPAEAAKMEEIANRFMPQSKFNLTIGDAEDRLQYYNAKLAATGFWSKAPSEREALLKTNGEIAGLKAAGDAIRDTFYGKLGQLEPNLPAGDDIASLKKAYGSLRNVGDQIRGRINVNDRQSPLSLKETIGMITGLGHGGPVGTAMAALPVLDRFGNSPENLISRAVQKAARPGEEGVVNKVATKAGKVVRGAAPEAAAVAGAGLGRIFFEASDGSQHSVPDNENAIAHAKQVDPGLKIIQ